MKIQNENDNALTSLVNNPQANKILSLLDVSENTLKEYRYRIKIFLDFINSNGFHLNSFLLFKQYLKVRIDLSISSKNKYLTVARIFLKECNRNGLIANDITMNVKSFVSNRKHKKSGLNNNEIELISNYLQQLPANLKNLRLRAILSLLIYQGLRQIEVVRLNVDDIDLNNLTASILGKGRDDKELIDLHPYCKQAIKEYLTKSKIADGAIFVSHSNYKRNCRLTTRSIRNIVKTIFRKLNIQRVVHGTRHYFVTKVLNTYKDDLTEVMKFTRHKSYETLLIYNDNLKHKTNLPRFYKAFNDIHF